MATNSICKNITVKKSQDARRLVTALSNASKKSSSSVILSKKCQEVKGDKIKELFGK